MVQEGLPGQISAGHLGERARLRMLYEVIDVRDVGSAPANGVYLSGMDLVVSAGQQFIASLETIE